MSVVKINVKVKVSAKEDKIGEWREVNGESILQISIKQIPERGKANESVIKLLSKEFKVPQKNIQIVSGHRSNTKSIVIECPGVLSSIAVTNIVDDI